MQRQLLVLSCALVVLSFVFFALLAMNATSGMHSEIISLSAILLWILGLFLLGLFAAAAYRRGSLVVFAGLGLALGAAPALLYSLLSSLSLSQQPIPMFLLSVGRQAPLWPVSLLAPRDLLLGIYSSHASLKYATLSWMVLSAGNMALLGSFGGLLQVVFGWARSRRRSLRHRRIL